MLAPSRAGPFALIATAALWAACSSAPETAAKTAAAADSTQADGSSDADVQTVDVSANQDVVVPPDVGPGDTFDAQGDSAADVGADVGVDATPDVMPTKLGTPTQLFDPVGVHVVHLTVDPANWTAYLDGIDTGEASKVYNWYLAAVKIDGVDYADVGIRGFGYGSQLLNPAKPNIRLKFDQFTVDGSGPEGQHSFRLKAAGQDPTFLREPIAYDLNRAIGGHAPRWSWAHVTVNGVDYGVYQLFEHVDKRMFKALFGNNDGNKYEAAVGCIGLNCPWGSCDKIPSAYTLDPGDGSELVALAKAITNATDEQFEANVSELINMDALLADYATDAMLSNLDGLASSGQNFTFYVNTATGKIEIISSGEDLTFGNFGEAWYDLLAPWGAPNSWCKGRIDWMFKRITQIPALKTKYLDKLRQLQCGPLSTKTLLPLIDAYAALVHSLVYNDPKGLVKAADLDNWYAALDAYIAQRADALQTLLGPCP